ncbi:MAG TPA: PaaI family thioesterase [Candidatus Dormibacteraeota bacterium]
MDLTSMGLDAQLGLEILEVTAQGARGRLRVDERHLQPMGLLHGGVHAACAEALASYGAVAAARQRDPDAGAVGLENHTSFVRAVRPGAELRIEAVPVHAGSRAQLWSVEIRDAGDRVVARSTVRLLVVLPGTV